MEKCLKVVSEETISFCFVLFFACNFFKKKIYLLFKKQKKRFLFFSLDKNYDRFKIIFTYVYEQQLSQFMSVFNNDVFLYQFKRERRRLFFFQPFRCGILLNKKVMWGVRMVAYKTTHVQLMLSNFYRVNTHM